MWTLPVPISASDALPVPLRADGYLYRVTTVRAAPGRLMDLIALFKAHEADYEARGDAPPFWMRHSQGDQWDLILMYPMESYAAYYGPERLVRRADHADVQRAFEDQLTQLVAWREDLYAFGPALADVAARFDGMGYFHVEMFKALPGKQDALIRQRKMENRYYDALSHPPNLIFVRESGSPVDVFTVGFYRDLQHFAAGADVPFETEDRAARDAGFDGVNQISPYLRSLIAWHHDTLAVRIR